MSVLLENLYFSGGGFGPPVPPLWIRTCLLSIVPFQLIKIVLVIVVSNGDSDGGKMVVIMMLF